MPSPVTITRVGELDLAQERLAIGDRGAAVTKMNQAWNELEEWQAGLNVMAGDIENAATYVETKAGLANLYAGQAQTAANNAIADIESLASGVVTPPTITYIRPAVVSPTTVTLTVGGSKTAYKDNDATISQYHTLMPDGAVVDGINPQWVCEGGIGDTIVFKSWATDTLGHVSRYSDEFELIITANDAPSIDGLIVDFPTFINKNQASTLTLTLPDDPNGDTVTARLANLVGCTAATTTGITESVEITQSGNGIAASFEVLVEDHRGAVSADSYLVMAVVNQPPNVGGFSHNMPALCGGGVPFTLVFSGVTDPNNDSVKFRIKSITNAAATATENIAGSVVITPGSVVGSVTVVLAAYDQHGAESDTITLTSPINNAPSSTNVTVAWSNPSSNARNMTYIGTVGGGTDAEGVVTYAVVAVSGATITSQPNASGVFGYTVLSTATAAPVFDFTVLDAGGLASAAKQIAYPGAVVQPTSDSGVLSTGSYTRTLGPGVTSTTFIATGGAGSSTPYQSPYTCHTGYACPSTYNGSANKVGCTSSDSATGAISGTSCQYSTVCLDESYQQYTTYYWANNAYPVYGTCYQTLYNNQSGAATTVTKAGVTVATFAGAASGVTSAPAATSQTITGLDPTVSHTFVINVAASGGTARQTT